MRAHDFIYNEKKLSEFGMIIASFDGSKGLETIDGAEITFNTVSSLGGSKYHLVSTQYEDCLTATIQIAKYSCDTDIQEISPHEYRELTKWLSRKGFYKFKILDEYNIDLYHEAAFTNISRIEIDGKLYGLELTIQTNRPFALKEPKTITIQTKKLYTWEEYYKNDDGSKGEATGEYVTSYDREFYPDNGVKIYFIDDSGNNIESKYYYVYKEEKNVASIFDESHEEGHIYPYTEITIDEDCKDFSIYNVLEDRETYFAKCYAGEVITMDYPVIQSSIPPLSSETSIQNDFNWNFFRIANTYENRRNDLTTSHPCTIKIKYSPIIKVGL